MNSIKGNCIERKLISSFLELGVGAGIDFKWPQRNFWGEGNIPKLDCGDGHNYKFTKNLWIAYL